MALANNLATTSGSAHSGWPALCCVPRYLPVNRVCKSLLAVLHTSLLGVPTLEAAIGVEGQPNKLGAPWAPRCQLPTGILDALHMRLLPVTLYVKTAEHNAVHYTQVAKATRVSGERGS